MKMKIILKSNTILHSFFQKHNRTLIVILQEGASSDKSLRQRLPGAAEELAGFKPSPCAHQSGDQFPHQM